MPRSRVVVELTRGWLHRYHPAAITDLLGERQCEIADVRADIDEAVTRRHIAHYELKFAAFIAAYNHVEFAATTPRRRSWNGHYDTVDPLRSLPINEAREVRNGMISSPAEGLIDARQVAKPAAMHNVEKIDEEPYENSGCPEPPSVLDSHLGISSIRSLAIH